MADGERAPVFPRPDEKTRREALQAAGPSWREWFYYDFLRTWAVLGFLIADAWVGLTFFGLPEAAVGIPLALGAALYLEFLAYRWLWYRPAIGRGRHDGPFRPTWLRPREFGRWTPENDRARSGLPALPHSGPDASEFL